MLPVWPVCAVTSGFTCLTAFRFLMEGRTNSEGRTTSFDRRPRAPDHWIIDPLSRLSHIPCVYEKSNFPCPDSTRGEILFAASRWWRALLMSRFHWSEHRTNTQRYISGKWKASSHTHHLLPRNRLGPGKRSAASHKTLTHTRAHTHKHALLTWQQIDTQSGARVLCLNVWDYIRPYI